MHLQGGAAIEVSSDESLDGLAKLLQERRCEATFMIFPEFRVDAHWIIAIEAGWPEVDDEVIEFEAPPDDTRKLRRPPWGGRR